MTSRNSNSLATAATLEERVQNLDWQHLGGSLSQLGYGKTPQVLTRAECDELIRMYSEEGRFRSRINMEQFRFGVGDYQYFAHPLPEIVEQLRTSFYQRLHRIANRWMEDLAATERYPDTLEQFLKICRKHGQSKATPLLLHYGVGGYNCLHQDLYGEIAFPLQLTCFLNEPGRDYMGGEFLLVEQRPRAQSKGEVIAPHQGEILIFTTRYRPVKGGHGYYRASIRHGVSRVTSGVRYTLGVIFHDAK